MMILASVALALLQSAPFEDVRLTPLDRAKDLVSRMTTDEKIAQCMMEAPAIPRLGVPKYHYWSEALHGIARNGVATVFPQAIGLAATWNPTLMQEVATTISTEARAKYAEATQRDDRTIYKGLTLWSPNVNIFRDPRWGRGQETYGEDPFLTSRIGVAFVKGIQGDEPTYLRAVATPKHFAVHSGPEPLRHGFDAKVTETELRETYLPAFEACVKEGKAASVMSAYSGFNGTPATGNPWLLTTLLRDEWGFNGAVVGDVDSVADIFYGHHATKDLAEASAMAIKAGNDECSGTSYKTLKAALDRGLVTVEDIDRATVRLFTLRFRLGMFDSATQCAYNAIPANAYDTPAGERLALTAARESLVLLKNDGVLPLRNDKYRQIAVIGSIAKSQQVLLGNYNGDPARPVTIFDGIQKKLESLGSKVEFANGGPLVNLGKGLGSFPRGSVFRDESKSAPGLKGEVFNNTDLSGTASATRNDRNLNLHWSNDQPISGIPSENSSIRWTGVVSWPTDETVSLGVMARGGIRLWLDDKVVVDDWKNRETKTTRVTYSFKKGNPVRVRLEYSHATGAANIQFGSNPIEQKPDFSEAEALARRSDLVILALGITPQLEGEEMPVQNEGFAGGDRTSILLPAPQRELLKRIKALGKPVVVVLTTGSALSIDPASANGILLQWYSGEQGGTAVADALVGDFNPAGRLPVTFYKSENDLPPFENYHLDGRTYRYFKGKALFPFGFGLSYSKFQYGTAKLSKTGNGFELTVPVTNNSPVSGDEVVQVYARYSNPKATDPVRRLVGFARVNLAARSSESVKVTVTDWALRSWNEQIHKYEVRPGGYSLEVGPWSGKAETKVLLQVN